jgi:outer membrane protein assembly factor BamB
MKRMYMYGIALFICIFYSFSCGKEEALITKDANGVVTGRPHIWAVPTSDDGQKCATNFVATEVSYDNDILVSARKSNQKIARMLNLSDGSTKWEWSNFIEQRDYFSIKNPCYQNKDLIWQADFWNYRIDLSNGKTKWKNAFLQHNGTYALDLQDNYACVNNYNKDGSIPVDSGGIIAIVSKSNGLVLSKITLSYDTLNILPFSQSNRLGSISFINTWNYQGDVMILVTYGDPPLKDWLFRDYIGLYNYTKKVWVYTKVLLTEPTQWGASNVPIVVSNRIYHTANHQVICHDILTGKKIWQTDVGTGKGFIFSPLIVTENRLYANSDDGYLHCINLDTGNVIWTIRSSGSSSKLNYINGVIYFVGGGDGKLHAVEAATGNYLWKIESPDLGKDKWAYFTGLCAVIAGEKGGKGKIVVLTGLNAYCYEAER